MSRRARVLSIGFTVLLVGASAAAEREARLGKSDSATLTAQAWRGRESTGVRIVSIDGRSLGEAPRTGVDGKGADAKGVTVARVSRRRGAARRAQPCPP